MRKRRKWALVAGAVLASLLAAACQAPPVPVPVTVLVPQTQPVSQYLWSQFTAAAKGALTDLSLTLDQRKAVLVGELNRVLESGALFDPVRFAGVVLHADTLALKNQTPAVAGQDLVRLNRWLLDDTHAAQLATSHEMDRLTGITNAILTGGASANTLDASAFTNGAVTLYGLDGNDLLIGGYHNDWLEGGNGNDVLYGGAGSDTILGNAGNDFLDGCGYIDTTLLLPDGTDLLFGGTGNDIYRFDITAQNRTPGNPTPTAPIPQGTDVVVENGGGGYADTLLGLGPNVLAVNLLTPLPQNYYDSNGHLVLTLNLNAGTAFHDAAGNAVVILFPVAGQVENSF